MSRRKKTLAEECDALIERHPEAPGVLSKRDRTRLSIYVGSLQGRFQDMVYALSSLLTYSQATDTTEDRRKEKREFYTTCFWVLSYSLFDIVAHIINVIHPVVSGERDVSFKKAKAAYGAQNPKLPQAILVTLKKIDSRQYFKRLDGYRHCCMHRRAVCTMEEATTVWLSEPYSGAVSSPQISYLTIVCDEPDDLRPKFTKRRKLGDECEMIRNEIEDDLKSILRLL